MEKSFKHAGGKEPIEACNHVNRQDVKDILINSYHFRANKKITQLPDSKLKFSSDKFHSDIKNIVTSSSYDISTPNIIYYIDFIKIFTWFFLALILNPLLLYYNMNTCLSCFLLGLLRSYIAITILHPISHYSYCINDNVRSYVTYLLSIITGVSWYWWRLDHIESHHIFSVGLISNEQPNESGYPLYRTHKSQLKLWFHRYQCIYALVMYIFSTIILIAYQFIFVIQQHDLPIKKRIKFIIPLILSFAVNHLFFDLSSNMWHLIPSGLYFTLSQLVNHRMPTVVDFVYKTKNDQKLTDESIDWAEYQIQSSVDFSVESLFWNEVLGGLNHQITHHLFPSIHYLHYPKLRKLLSKHYQKEKMIAYKNWAEAIYVHMRLLNDNSS
jgi:linoleoyl-CoA desaturase